MIDADAHVNEDPFAGPSSAELHPGWLGAGQVRRQVGRRDRREALPDAGGPGLRRADRLGHQPALRGRRRRPRPAARRHGRRGHRRPGALRRARPSGVTGYDDAGFALDVRARLQRLAARQGLRPQPAPPEGRRRRAAAGRRPVDRASSRACSRSARSRSRSRRCSASATSTTESLLPFFEAAADADLAVAVHSAPGMNLPLPGAERFDNYAQVHCLSFPVDQMVAFTALAMGGVLDRVPDAARRVPRVAASAGCPYFVHRMHEHREKRRDLLPAMTSDPRAIVERGQCYFSFEAEEPLLDHLRRAPRRRQPRLRVRLPALGLATSPARWRRCARWRPGSATTSPRRSSAATPSGSTASCNFPARDRTIRAVRPFSP